ncbi:MAG: zinc-ribbon domain-containing protein [Clostridia bacterium]|nr:zinc-ribbon domain-containing protein [Clostridia bacterium]
MFCRNCGKEIDDNAVFCPHCGSQTLNTAGGQPQAQQQPQVTPVGQPNVQPFNVAPQTEPKGTNGLGIAGFVLGLLSLYLGVYFCITPIVGLVLSIIGVTKMKTFKSCNGLAIAGLVISIIATVIWGLVWLILGAAIIAYI